LLIEFILFFFNNKYKNDIIKVNKIITEDLKDEISICEKDLEKTKIFLKIVRDTSIDSFVVLKSKSQKKSKYDMIKRNEKKIKDLKDKIKELKDRIKEFKMIY